MASIACSAAPLRIRTRWRELVQPKEHGSWSLALEPLALGSIAATSITGLWLAVAAVAGFLARRPLKIAARDRDPARRQSAFVATITLAFIATLALATAIFVSGTAWLVWLLPCAMAGGVFLVFDWRNDGRGEVAEIAGATAFAALTLAFAAAAGWSAAASVALGFAMLARTVPTVIFVRACVRGGKSGEFHAAPPLIAATVALGGAIALASAGLVPLVVPFALAALLARAAARLIPPRPIRARTLGLQELAIGAAYVTIVGAAWRW